MNDSDDQLNERGNHQGEFAQGVGGWAEYTVFMTPTEDKARHEVTVPPGKVIPIIFLPGVMGSNLRMSKVRQEELDRPDNRSWRPDDMMSMSGQTAVVSGVGLGGWFKNATPAQRQLVFDPNETEVEYYYYTESKGRFDPQGKETLAADARHQNVPHTLSPIPPLIGSDRQISSRAERMARHQTPAQVARWRGWSEVVFAGAYGDMLQLAEKFLNNIVKNKDLTWWWQANPKDAVTGSPLPVKNNALTKLLLQNPTAFGASSGDPITESDLREIAACWYPVHAMGYNFIKSNGESAKVIAERIRGLVKGYQQRGFKCDEVILITHSMGGLLARALIHPAYGNLLNAPMLKILGMYHSAMPALGAAGAYKRMRFGFQEKPGYASSVTASVLGIDGRHATAILANAPAPLEMMPGKAYGAGWLKLIDKFEMPVTSWPKEGVSALDDIYLQPERAWWRLLTPLWVNPANVSEENGGGMGKVQLRIKNAAKFLESIGKTYHPCCYASYCASSKRRSYGDVVFKVTRGEWSTATDPTGLKSLPPPESWTLISDNAKDTLTVQAGARVLTLQLQTPVAAGDETVPALRSAQHINGHLFVHGKSGDGYEHQNSYADPQVLASMLYSIVQIAKTAKWK